MKTGKGRNDTPQWIQQYRGLLFNNRTQVGGLDGRVVGEVGWGGGVCRGRLSGWGWGWVPWWGCGLPQLLPKQSTPLPPRVPPFPWASLA